MNTSDLLEQLLRGAGQGSMPQQGDRGASAQGGLGDLGGLLGGLLGGGPVPAPAAVGWVACSVACWAAAQPWAVRPGAGQAVVPTTRRWHRWG
ncbi:hypothetical protein PS710_00529 [Pseudomonas fluorescens]|uniref:DUF533 domain-containing protein n=1 Tax=Pseudomonas fluorescens TaxID=294 RepID=A0A5E7A127_PSEFL|nr:hypothetical protein PS710_00529 [Pseudomonas fluorescens]